MTSGASLPLTQPPGRGPRATASLGNERRAAAELRRLFARGLLHFDPTAPRVEVVPIYLSVVTEREQLEDVVLPPVRASCHPDGYATNPAVANPFQFTGRENEGCPGCCNPTWLLTQSGHRPATGAATGYRTAPDRSRRRKHRERSEARSSSRDWSKTYRKPRGAGVADRPKGTRRSQAPAYDSAPDTADCDRCRTASGRYRNGRRHCSDAELWKRCGAGLVRRTGHAAMHWKFEVQ